MTVQAFTDGYIETLVFTCPTTEDHLHPGDMGDTCEALASLVPAEVRAVIEGDASRFYEANVELIEACPDIKRAGGHLAYTRNGHGTGYWDDPGIPAHVSEALTEAARAEGERNLLVENWEDTATWDYA